MIPKTIMDRRTLHRMSLHAVIVLAFFTGMGFSPEAAAR
jgi:hypothetical protein